jgi:hypothetical protein
VYAVKEAHIMAPWADVVYSADFDWWDRMRGLPDFMGERWTVSDEAAARWKLKHIPGTSSIEWGKDASLIAYGGNSGFQALNLAVVQGATKVLLLGYDYGFNPSQKKHWFDGTQHHRDSRRSDYADWIKRIDAAAKLIPVPVINCTRTTAIRCFPRMPIDEAIYA